MHAHLPTPIPGFGNLAPGMKVDRKTDDGWDPGWIVKDSSGGMHKIWKMPHTQRFICNQRIGIEIRVSNGTPDEEEL